MFAKAVISLPHTPELHTKEKEASHKVLENAKTLYGSYDSVNGGQIFSDPVDIIWVIVGHVKREHIESLYRTSPGKFVTVLERPNLKELYNYEVTFREKAGNIDHNFTILHKPPRFCVRDNRYDENGLFLTTFLPKTISDIAVHLAFRDCGSVHQLFAGTYKKDFQKIQNSKHLIRLSSLR